MNVQSRDTGSVGHNIKNGYHVVWRYIEVITVIINLELTFWRNWFAMLHMYLNFNTAKLWNQCYY